MTEGAFKTHFMADQSNSMARGLQSLISVRLSHTTFIPSVSVLAQCWAPLPTLHSNLGQPAPLLPPPASPSAQLALSWLSAGFQEGFCHEDLFFGKINGIGWEST